MADIGKRVFEFIPKRILEDEEIDIPVGRAMFLLKKLKLESGARVNVPKGAKVELIKGKKNGI